MDISLNDDVDASNAVEGDLDVLVVAPVAHAGHVDAFGLVLFVACMMSGIALLSYNLLTAHTLSENNVRVERRSKLPAGIRLLPRVVIEAALDIAAILVAVKPDI